VASLDRLDQREGGYHFREGPVSVVTAGLEDKEMAQPKEPDERAIRGPARVIETVNRVVRASQQMLPEIGRQPTPEELAEKLGMPLDKVRRVLAIANRPIRLETPIGSG
jgi:DNA-directed RNA polymerase sigma subunit (sigma70/sigma32)